jgi:hypothetical protein
MDNELEGKNILFYSENQNDILSAQCLEILKNSPLLNEQFYKFSVNNPKIKIPNMIRQQNITPIIAVSGFNELMKGPQALDWIKNNNLNSSKKNEYDYVNIDKGQSLSSSFSSLGDTFTVSGASQNHNSEFNKGTDYADTSYYATVNEKSNIDTYEEQQNNSSKYNQNEKLFNNFKNARQQDLQQINKNMKLDVSNYQQSLSQEETRKPKYEQPAMQYNPNIGNNNTQYEQQQREEVFQKFLHQDSPIQQNNQPLMHSRQYNPNAVPQQPMRQGYGGPMVGKNSNNTRKTNQFPSFDNGGVTGFSGNSSYASW